MTPEFRAATKPTMHFIGVTTGQSSINAVFPRWAQRLGLGDCALRGMDFALNDAPERYRAAVDFIKRDPLSLGALVTSHKISLHRACRDQFDVVDPLSESLGEISSIYKRGAELHGRSVDPWTSGYALESFLPRDHWRGGGEVLILGAGGAGTALAWHLSQSAAPGESPRRILAVDRDPARLEHLRALHRGWGSVVPLECHAVASPIDADALLSRLSRGSLIANATGAGKDTPGSPLSDAAVFPEQARVWEFNYRGELRFLQQARAQKAARQLHVEDGWTYFLHGWTRVIADVFAVEIPPRGPLFDDLGRIAAAMRS